jgi:hypothetical protein
MERRKFIERIVRDNSNLNGAEAITMCVEGETKKGKMVKWHYYIFKIEDSIKNHDCITLPLEVAMKQNGKTMPMYYEIVAVYDDGYVLFSLNKRHKLQLNYGLPSLVGLPINEAEIVVID